MAQGFRIMRQGQGELAALFNVHRTSNLRGVKASGGNVVLKIGFISMPHAGHMYPMTALAQKMVSRGHEVIFFGLPDAEKYVQNSGLQMIIVGSKQLPLGRFDEKDKPTATMRGLDVLRFAAGHMQPAAFNAVMEDLPAKLRESGVEAVVIDTIHLFAELAAIEVGLPYVHVWAILHMDFSGATPPSPFPWAHEDSPEARERNMQGVMELGKIFTPVAQAAMAYVERKHLPVDMSVPGATTSRLAVITQTPAAFDFPGAAWPTHFHHVGPLLNGSGRKAIAFPWEQLTGQPLIYASMGTLVNGDNAVYRAILGVAEALPEIQLVLSIGENISRESLGTIPANAIVVPKAPQLELLQRAVLCITHAGLNTALESLTQGVPMVAIPVGYDQPGVAARAKYHGVGEFVEAQDLAPNKLLSLVQTVLGDATYAENARKLQKLIQNTDGPTRAADLIEAALLGALATNSQANSA